MTRVKFITAAIIAVLVILFFALDGHEALAIGTIKTHYDQLLRFESDHPISASLAYFGVYTLITTLSLPGAVPLTLLGGSLFGLWGGTLIISFASTLGATFALLLARFLMGDFLRGRFKGQAQRIIDGFNQEGEFFLFALRLSPIFSFFLVNLFMGLTSISLWRYYLISQIGMLPGTIVYVNAGSELAHLDSLSDILSTQFVLSFSALGILPWISVKALHYLRKQRDT